VQQQEYTVPKDRIFSRPGHPDQFLPPPPTPQKFKDPRFYKSLYIMVKGILLPYNKD